MVVHSKRMRKILYSLESFNYAKSYAVGKDVQRFNELLYNEIWSWNIVREIRLTEGIVLVLIQASYLISLCKSQTLAGLCKFR